MNKEIIKAKNAPDAVGPYSHAIMVDNVLYTSGQIGLIPESGVLAEGGIKAQAEQSIINLGAVLEASGMDYKNVVKTTLFLKDINDFAVVNEIYAKYFTEKPARSCVQAAALPKGALFEIEAIAVK